MHKHVLYYLKHRHHDNTTIRWFPLHGILFHPLCTFHQDPHTHAPPPPGNARVYECLESHRNDEGFSPECKDEFEKMMERRAADFRLDFKLREMCKRDIDQLCSYEKESLDSVEGFDARVIVCLQDFRDELSDGECRNAVHKVVQRAAEDIRFDEPLADACYQDRKQFCPNAHAVRMVFVGVCWCLSRLLDLVGSDDVNRSGSTQVFGVAHRFQTTTCLSLRVLHVSSAACRTIARSSPLSAVQPCLTRRSAWLRTSTSSFPFAAPALQRSRRCVRASLTGMPA